MMNVNVRFGPYFVLKNFDLWTVLKFVLRLSLLIDLVSS
jgi:hypothetical protein